MLPLLVLPAGRTIAALDGLSGKLAFMRQVQLPEAGTLDPDRPTVLLASAAQARQSAESLGKLAEQAAIIALGEPGANEPDKAFPIDLLSGFIPADAPPAAARLTVLAALRHAATLVAAQRSSRLERQSAADVRELTAIGVALSTERDLMTLLDLILTQARHIGSADAGSLYLAEQGESGERVLRFKLSQNHTLPDLPFRESVIPLNAASVAGYAASTGEPLVIPDVYLLPLDVPYQFNRSFDEKMGYRTKSMLVIPMESHRDEIVGVVQLINRKRSFDAVLDSAQAVEREVVGFDKRAVDLVGALASQAAVAIENSRLYEDIERLFEGFVTAAVTAIESRDPTTSGHSFRVATLTCGLAEAVDRGGAAGEYRSMKFSREQLRELRYAGLLHDFGKVGVREQVLVKQKKLYPGDLAIVRHRFEYLLQRADLQFERERAEFLIANGNDRYDQAVVQLEEVRRGERERLHRFVDAIVRANEPTVMPEGTFEELQEINRSSYTDFDGTERPLLGDEELRFLMINRGNLDATERREIESHVTHTFRFLEQIPWTRELRGIPEIAYGHHEKLNGRGYPRQVAAAAIPVQTRMMTISDIYDALTATDRPYKRAVPLERALDILRGEATDGALDGALLDAFIEAKVFDSLRAVPAPD